MQRKSRYVAWNVISRVALAGQKTLRDLAGIDRF